MLTGALRREKAAGMALQKSEAEIEHMSRLVCLLKRRNLRFPCSGQLLCNFRNLMLHRRTILVVCLMGCMTVDIHLQACQREEDAQRTKMMLKFREDKIKQLELLVNGCSSTENHLVKENQALKEEIQLLQGKIDRNPELTRFALENIRLLEQLQS